MRQNRPHNNNIPNKRKQSNQKNFEIELLPNIKSNLEYFILQELGYYNTLVEQLVPRLKAFPQDILSIKDKEKRIWDACAEHAINPQKLLDHPRSEWPKHLDFMYDMLYDQAGKCKISPAHISIMGIAASPARLHQKVRRAIASEVLKYMLAQADVLFSAMKTETLKSPVQMLQTYTTESKRHLQIPYSLLKIRYNEESDKTYIGIPYSKAEIELPHVDLTQPPFRLLVIRSPNATSRSSNQKWEIDIMDSLNDYIISLNDPVERKRRI